MKKCTKCGVEKPLSSFTKNSKRIDGCGSYCLLCKKAYDKIWEQNNQEKRKNIALNHYYGINLDDFNKIKEFQNNKCAICEIELVDTKDTCLDHCHETNKIRGILCSGCNRGLGAFKDSKTALKAAIKYLSHFENWGSIKKD